MADQHYANAVTAAINANQRVTVLPYCDACEDDHASRVTADGAIVCAREGEDR